MCVNFVESFGDHVAEDDVGVFEVLFEEIGAVDFSFPSPENLAYFCDEVNKGVAFESDCFCTVLFFCKVEEASVAGAHVIYFLSLFDAGGFNYFFRCFHWSWHKRSATKNRNQKGYAQKDYRAHNYYNCYYSEPH